MKRKIRRTDEINDVTVLDDATPYINVYDTSNAVVLPPKKKQRRKKKDVTEAVVNRKREEVRKRRQSAKKAKLSKAKQKKLSKLAESKKKKASREALLESLKEYQLPQGLTSKLQSNSQLQQTNNIMKRVSSKLRALTGKEIQSAKELRDKFKQDNYYETGSESDESEQEDEGGVICDAVHDEMPSAMCLPSKESITEVAKESMCEGMSGVRECSSTESYTTEREHPNEKHSSNWKERFKMSGANTRKNVLVKRRKEVEERRAKLPIYAEEQVVVETINENDIVIVCGETGSGKTTQIPQFLYEAGYAADGKLIGITEPRRVAAISMAERVGEEMDLLEKVSYQIRFEGNRSPDTSILFMTDGVLLKELQKDFALSSYSVIVIDEAHERSMFSDVLIGLLSRIVPYRSSIGNPLKLIIMSATLRLDDFTHNRLFPKGTPALLKIDARQYPVNIHFEKKTPENYLLAAFQKVCRIHEELAQGNILVFVSGRLEVITLLKWLVMRYPVRQRSKSNAGGETQKERLGNSSPHTNVQSEEGEAFDYEERFAGADAFDADEYDIYVSDDMVMDDEDAEKNAGAPLYCLPLYSLLSSKKQQRIFQPAHGGHRMCVIATNVAETSITIPAVRYVVDTGREKRRRYDPITGVSQFIVHWITRASADQRAGRAGRVQEGHVYRLYSSAVYSDFEKFNLPEIMTKPVDQLVLQLKSMNIIKVAHFPFPTSPSKDVLEESEIKLTRLGALATNAKNNVKGSHLTALGKTLCIFPLGPGYAKMLVMAKQHNLLAYVLCLVSALSVREPLISLHSIRGTTAEETQQLILEALKMRRSWCPLGQARRFGDLTILLTAVLKAEAAGNCERECGKLGIHHKALIEIRKLRSQLTGIINTSCQQSRLLEFEVSLKSPTEKEIRLIRQIVIASLCDNIARKVDANEDALAPNGSYQCQKLREYVFINPSSVLYKDEPEWILYQEIVEANGKKYVQNVIAVEPEWLPHLADTHCYYAPIKDAVPRYDAKSDAVVVQCHGTFGQQRWPLDVVERPLTNDINLYRHFARFFLEGRVCPELAPYADKLLASPSAMLKSWAHLQKRTQRLLEALIEHDVTNRENLLKVWKVRSEYLLDEYLEWLPQFLHESVQLSWPPNKS